MNVRRGISQGLAVAGLAVLSGPTSAGILEFIRDYDLNDYSLGVAITVNQSPYTAGSSSVLPYPFLTSFTNPAFTRDWLLLFDDAGTGARYVSGNGFEIGAVGRMRTGGFGSDVTEEFFELREREWTLEAGALVGWRGWPIHLQARAFTDIVGRHGGNVTEAQLSWPIQRDWGFVIPMVTAVHQSGEFNRYYYGIEENESAPGRPVYTPGADTNFRLRVRAGYRLSDRWLLTGYVQVESLGDEVHNSPIVDRDRVYSYNLGLAYNADVFNPRDYEYTSLPNPKVVIRVGAFRDNITTEFQLDKEDGLPGDILDLETDAASPDSQWVPEIDLFVRLGNYHRLEFGYFEVGRDSSTITLVPRRVGNIELPENLRFEVATRLQVLRAMYSYSLTRDAQKELALSGGLHRSKFEIDITNSDGDREFLRGDALLPVIGANGSVAFGAKTLLSARLQFFRSSFDNYDGYMVMGNLDWSRHITDKARAGIALNLYMLRLESTLENFSGTYRTLHWGPSLFFTAGF